MPLLTNSRKNTTLLCVKKPQTTADSTRGRVENCSSCLNTASWRNKAKIFEIHLRCADPRSILATMFHGQRMLSARPKPCCRLAEFQIRLFAKFSSKHHKNQMLVSRVQTWRPGNSEVPRPLRTARSRSRLSYTPLGQTSLRVMNARLVGYAWRKTNVGKKNNGQRIQAGSTKEILENNYVPRSEQ